jgi:hypothetical protein
MVGVLGMHMQVKFGHGSKLLFSSR